MKIVDNEATKDWILEKRFSELNQLHNNLIVSLGGEDNLPPFPKKKVFGNTEPDFITQRKREL